jgi:hypothetical protein
MQMLTMCPVDFSGKITNSVVGFLVERGVEFSTLTELTELPPEFLRDPTSWLPAKKVESFLAEIDSRFHALSPNHNLLEHVGHQARDLKAWGVLDSVLRMIEKPQDIYLQPQRFISYFVAPSPPIANLQRNAESVAFDLPISYEEYPATNLFLRSALESLPQFIGLEMAEVAWVQTRIVVNWAPSQVNFELGAAQERRMAPEFMDSIIATLERTEKALEERTRELERIKQENTKAAQSKTGDLEKWFDLYRNLNRYSQQVMKLQDYFTRSQQLITLLVGQNRLNVQVKEAMKRVGWDTVQTQFPELTSQLLKDFEEEKQFLHNMENKSAKDSENSRARDTRQPWLPHS